MQTPDLMDQLKKVIESGAQYKIFFIGDSITSTEWVHPNWREIFEYVLKQELESQYTNWKLPSWGIRCFNYGFDGSTTQDIKHQIERGFIPSNANLVIYMTGDNDKYDQIPPEEYQSNIQTSVSLLNSSYIILSTDLCTGNPQVNQKYESGYYQTVPKVKLTNGHFVDVYSQTKNLELTKFYTFISSGNEVAGLKPGEIDIYHPNQLGNAYVAGLFLKSAFNMSFNPHKYLAGHLNGQMFPDYK